MPEYLRALIIILFLATIFFVFAHRFASTISEDVDFKRRRNLWFALTLAGFLANNFWLYMLIAIPLLGFAKRRETNIPALFFFVLFVLPMAFVQIPGMGVINFLFDLSPSRVLVLLILLPAFFSLRRHGDVLSFGRTWPDKAFAAYILLTVILSMRGNNYGDATPTSIMRQVFYLFIDVFLPYFIISRSLKKLQDFRDAILSFVLAIMVLAPLAIFESLKHWLLYAPATAALGLERGMTGYMGRGDALRAIVTAGHPIALGYLMTVGIGLYLFLQRSIQQKLVRRLGMMLLAVGLIAPVSRGPWVGAAASLVVFIATGRNPVRHLMSTALVVVLSLSLVSMLPGGEKLINLLPFIGTTDKGSVDYREQLITNSMIVIQRSPWFGSVDYMRTPEMQAMMQGEHIIDVVNTYVGIALDTGFIGLGLFVAFFALTLSGIYRAMRSTSDRNSEEYLLGRALLVTTLAILVTISTVSSITIIPIVYWSVAGLGVAYAQMMNEHTDRRVLNQKAIGSSSYL